ncbi:MAG: hypothetical protein KDA60_02905 [Planctomycetales bacterium]|nr:hypothetical protein [Planctomycetales bacterium]
MFRTLTKSRRSPRRCSSQLRYENLETRRLMAADITYNAASDEVAVVGTDLADHIVIENEQVIAGWTYQNGQLRPLYSNGIRVTVRDLQGNLRQDSQGNPLDETFTSWSVQRVRVDALNGTDTVENETNVRSTLIGGGDRDILRGGSNDDIIWGEGGNDSIYGGTGNDVLNGGADNDTLHGNGGNDTYLFLGGSYYSLPADQVFTIDEGTDTIYELANSDADTLDFGGVSEGITIDLADTGSSRFQQVHDGLVLRLMNSNGLENVEGTPYNDTIRGNGRPNRIDAGYGSDTLEGRGGDDRLDGSRGRDFYVFGDDATGDDEVFDYYLDGARNRLDFRDHATGITLDIDTEAWQQVSSSLRLRLDHADTIKEVVGSDHADTIFGNYENNTIWGRAGGDTISGRDGNDTLYGNDGNDTLNGNGGHDSIYGHNGDDTLSGGSGNDYLSGGNGNDTLTGNSGIDTLRGYAGDDSLFGDLDDSTVDGGTGWDYHRNASWWFWWG